MNKVLPLCILLLSGVVPQMAAQTTATFSYEAIQPNSDDCTPITEWNGVADSYPYDMGMVCFNFYPNVYSGLQTPYKLGFPNNGYLLDQPGFRWSAAVFTNGGNMQTNGSTFYEIGTASYAYGVSVSVQANFVVQITKTCYRGVCRAYTTTPLTSGTGSASF